MYQYTLQIYCNMRRYHQVIGADTIAEACRKVEATTWWIAVVNGGYKPEIVSVMREGY